MGKKRKKKYVPIEHEILEAPGMTLERVDRFITLRTYRTPEEQSALLGRLQEVSLELPLEIKKTAQELENLFRELNTFDVLGYISLSNLMINPNAYVESEHHGSSFAVEYATLLLLKGPYNAGKRLLNPEDCSRIQEMLHNIQQLFQFRAIARSADPAQPEPPDEREALQYLAESYEMFVRSPAYPQHLREINYELFEPYSSALREILGFDYSDAAKIIQAIGIITSDRLSDRIRAAQTQRKDLLRALSEQGVKDSAQPFAELSTLPKKEREHWVQNVAYAWVFTLAGNSLAFVPTELAERADLPVSRVRAFLELLTLRFGEVPTDLYLPKPVHPLKIKPLVRHEERWLLPVPSLLEWAIRPALEKALEEAAGWNRFVAHRHRYLLNKAIGLTTKALPGAEAHTEVKYSIPGSPSPFEVDGLLLMDSVLVILEVKAGAFTIPAREGHADRLERDLRKLVTESHSQAIRAADYINANEESIFHTNGGAELRLRKRDFRHVFLVTVMLEPIGHLSARLRGDSALFPSRSQVAWTTNIYDLIVISELAEPPPLLLHYLVRRIRGLKQVLLEGSDELDLFAAYLHNGLYIDRERIPSDLDSIVIGTFTDNLDAYYMFQEGVRRYAKKPTVRFMSPEFRTFIEALAASSVAKRLDLLLHLLNMDGDSRQKWIKAVVQSKRRFRKDGRLHNFTQMKSAQTDFGFSYFVGDAEGEREGLITDYCRRKMTESGAKGWIAVEDSASTTRYSFRRVLVFGDVSVD